MANLQGFKTRYAVDNDAKPNQTNHLVFTGNDTKFVNVENADFISIQVHGNGADGNAVDFDGGTIALKVTTVDRTLSTFDTTDDWVNPDAGAVTLSAAGLTVLDQRPLRELQFVMSGSTSPDVLITVSMR